MAKVIIQNLSKQYKGGTVRAVDNISFDCPDGKFFCLLGPAGAGKTTTIKLIAGIENITEGKIFFDEQEVTNLLPKDRDIAVAFETYALYPQLKVRENLAFPLKAPIRKNEWPANAIETRVVEIANLLGIGDLLDRYPRQLSGGQRQRVALGRALVRKPRAYLLDEPIAHLDAKLRHRMRGELKRIQMELGITTLYTTPDQLEALSLADVMAVLNQGRIEQYGTPDEIYKHPANVFVARFVGDPPMNILEGQVADNCLVIPGLTPLPIPPEILSVVNGGIQGNSVLVGLRPKDIRLVPPVTGEAHGVGQIKNTQILGETSIITFGFNSTELRAKLATHEAPGKDENIGFLVNLEECHFFNPQTKFRIN